MNQDKEIFFKKNLYSENNISSEIGSQYVDITKSGYNKKFYLKTDETGCSLWALYTKEGSPDIRTCIVALDNDGNLLESKFDAIVTQCLKAQSDSLAAQQACLEYSQNCQSFESQCQTHEINCKDYESQCLIHEQNCSNLKNQCSAHEENCKNYESQCQTHEQNCEKIQKQLVEETLPIYQNIEANCEIFYKECKKYYETFYPPEENEEELPEENTNPNEQEENS